jgi:hypothetical protein
LELPPGLSKSFVKVNTVDTLDLEIPSGEVFESWFFGA